MENPLNITALNDFIFCPVSIYFHMLYDGVDKTLYQSTAQINGSAAHKSIDTNAYSNSAYLLGLDVYCEKYNLCGKIDMYNKNTKALIERKKKIKAVYDGYVFQLYAQYFSMTEMGYEVEKLIIHSIDDNKNYYIDLPKDNSTMLGKFERIIDEINCFDLDLYKQSNKEKCSHCIYSPYCDRELS